MRFSVIIVVLFTMLVCSCRYHYDRPPEGECPEPLCGIYAGESGKLIFNGDGKTVSVLFTVPMLASMNRDTMEYVFTFGSYGSCSYNKADRFCVWSNEDTIYTFSVFQCTSDSLQIYYDEGEEQKAMIFRHLK